MVGLGTIDLDQTGNTMNDNAQTGGIRHMIFTCPVTNLNVQHRLEAASNHDYELVTCLACTGVHFINLRTGKVLRRDKE